MVGRTGQEPGQRAGALARIFPLGPVAACVLLAQPAIAAADNAAPVDVAAQVKLIEDTAAVALRRAGSKAERQLLQADLDFAADAARMHVSEAFAKRVAADGLMIGSGDPVIAGREAIRQALSRSKAQWHWTPVQARVGGDLGVTWGIASLLYKDAQSVQRSLQTRYITVWQRRGGRWEIWLDAGMEGPPPIELLHLGSPPAAER